MLISVVSTDARNIIRLPPDCKDVDNTLSRRASCCIVGIGDLEVYEIQPLLSRTENLRWFRIISFESIKVLPELTNIGGTLFDVNRTLSGRCIAAVVTRLNPISVVASNCLSASRNDD